MVRRAGGGSGVIITAQQRRGFWLPGVFLEQESHTRNEERVGRAPALRLMTLLREGVCLVWVLCWM
jgi:hypothetical protein